MNAKSFVTSSCHNEPITINQIVVLRNAMLIVALVFVYSCIAAAQTRPTITGFLVDGVVSNWAAVGATVTIQGSGFGSTIGFGDATLSGIPVAGDGVKPISWTDTSIVVLIPLTAFSGPVAVSVLEQGHRVLSNTKRLNVRVEITGVLCAGSPCASAPVGARVTLIGNGFGEIPGKAAFNGVQAVTGAWFDNSVDVIVPEGATSGPIRAMEQGVVSNPWPFTITP